MWVPWQKGVFGFVFNFCFYHSILWFLSDELAKLKTTFGCFQVMDTELWWHFGKYTHFWDPRSEKSHPYFFFSPPYFFSHFFFTYSLNGFFLILSFSLFLSSSQTHSNGHFFLLLHSFSFFSSSQKHIGNFIKKRKRKKETTQI